jgi:hypothetical protein
MAQGDGKPDPAPAAALAETTRVYPLWAEEKSLLPMSFPNASGVRVNMMYPVDNDYWAKLKEFVDYEPVSAISPETRGLLAAIGIVKNAPFLPSARQKELLLKAVEAAPRMILATRQLGRDDRRNLYYEDRQFERAWSGATADWMQESYLDLLARSSFFQYAYSSAPAMVMRTIGAGSKYPFTARDADGEFLDGSSSYKLRLPPNPPAAAFWAVTVYNVTDGTMPETPQLLPSLNGYCDLAKNEDGSIDIWMGPSLPGGAPGSNFIQTVAGRNFLVALRLYGAKTEFYDQTWKPDDVVKVN